MGTAQLAEIKRSVCVFLCFTEKSHCNLTQIPSDSEAAETVLPATLLS